MRIFVFIMLVATLTGTASHIGAQTPPQSAVRTAVLETRLVRDSAGCPSAVDLWLVSTTDTIQGLEAVLQWDRPDRIQFLRGAPSAPKKQTAADSLTAMLKPSDPNSQIPVGRQGSVIAAWEFVEARSANGNSAKILAVAKLFGQNESEPLLPGASGSLLRIPLAVLAGAGIAADTGAAILNFDAAGTRLSTHRGALFGPLTLKPTAVDPRGCGVSKARR